MAEHLILYGRPKPEAEWPRDLSACFAQLQEIGEDLMEGTQACDYDAQDMANPDEAKFRIVGDFPVLMIWRLRLRDTCDLEDFRMVELRIAWSYFLSYQRDSRGPEELLCSD